MNVSPTTSPAPVIAPVIASAGTLRVAFVGEVDHGKSTLLGRLLHDTGAITPDRLGTPIEDGGLAFLLDGLAEEQRYLFTLDTAQAVLETARQRYVLIDVPGHVELLKNMVTGASRAEVGVIVVDCLERAVEQTRRHMRVLAMMGVTVCVCAVTKMDLVGYAEKAFRAVAGEMGRLATQCGIQLAAVVPVSAFIGVNVTSTASDVMPWYSGSSLLETLEELSRRPDAGPLRIEVQCVLDGSRRVLGRVLSGTVRPGQVLLAGSTSLTCTVVRIERYGEPPMPQAHAGDSVGLVLDGHPPSPGALLAPPSEPLRWARLWHVRVLCTSETGFGVGERCVLRHVSAALPGRIVEVGSRWSSADAEPTGTPEGIDLPAAVGRVRFSQTADMVVELDAPAAADAVRSCAPLGHVVLCEPGGSALGIGIIDRVGSGDQRCAAAPDEGAAR